MREHDSTVVRALYTVECITGSRPGEAPNTGLSVKRQTNADASIASKERDHVIGPMLGRKYQLAQKNTGGCQKRRQLFDLRTPTKPAAPKSTR